MVYRVNSAMVRHRFFKRSTLSHESSRSSDSSYIGLHNQPVLESRVRSVGTNYVEQEAKDRAERKARAEQSARDATSGDSPRPNTESQPSDRGSADRGRLHAWYQKFKHWRRNRGGRA